MKIRNLLKIICELDKTGELPKLMEHDLTLSVSGLIIPIEKFWIIEDDKLIIFQGSELCPANKKQSLH